MIVNSYRIIMLMLVGLTSAVVRGESNIDAVSKYAWAENVGWTNWRDADSGSNGVQVSLAYLSGYIWGENVGWINVGDGTPDNEMYYANSNGLDYGVNIDSNGDLFGLAWGENIGWINFDTRDKGAERARIDCDATRFLGYVWSENTGWVNLDDMTHFVAFDYCIECTLNADCDDSVFCNGLESCDTDGLCQAGTPVDCDDGVDCTVDTCDADTDGCINVASNGLCDDGLFCNGMEWCDVMTGCQAGTDPCPGEECDEELDTCPLTGACCNGTGGCQDDSDQAFCEQFTGFSYAGDGTECVDGVCDLGACCVAGQCEETVVGVCTNQGGDFFVGESCGTFTCPAATGACCNGIGGCQDDIERSFCEQFAGFVYGGDGTTCSGGVCELGACCLLGDCKDLVAVACASSNGEFHVGTDCETSECPIPTGACCVQGIICVDDTTEVEDCIGFFSGEWAGPFTTCPIVDTDLCPLCDDGDIDGDLDVDLYDFAAMQECFALPYAPRVQVP
jgi:hypothetical protein